MDGYFAGLAQRGIVPNPAWIKRGIGNFAAGHKATLELLALPAEIRPTAVITMNDSMAVGSLQAAKEAGLWVGHDFAIAGFDDSPMVQYLDPPLTSVRQPVWDVGQQIIPMLLNYIESGQLPDPISIMVLPRLIVRGSTTGERFKVIST
jgi:DNA-binding LacI/PurR family transcriptional regulator